MEMQQMKQVKIQDVQGKALDYLVAKCEGFGPGIYMRNIDIKLDVHGKCSQLSVPINRAYVRWAPSTEWAQGGPIVDRERISIDYDTDVWNAAKSGLPWYLGGCTALVASMRCYVASKLGDVVEVPASLL